jgi:hypothetical protein
MNFFCTRLIIFFAGFFWFAAYAQESNKQLQQEIHLLKSKVEILAQKLEASQTNAKEEAQVELAEFERIKNKTESLEDQFESQGIKGLKISGALDPVFVANQRQNSVSFSFLNNFNANDPSSAYSTKYRLTLAFGKSAGSVNNASALLHEASVSIPLSDLQTRLLVGQIPDFSGYEPFFSHQQPLISHNLLFDFAAPAFYTGAGVEILRDKWLTKAIVGNMNYARYKSGDRIPTLALRVDYAKGEFKGFGFSTQNGKIGNSRFNLFEVDTYYIRGDLTLQSELATGKQERAAFNGQSAHWTGASALLGYRFIPRYQFTLRADAVRNSSNGGGILGSAGTNCYSATGTLIQAGLDCRNGFGPGMVQDTSTGLWSPGNAASGANRQALSLGLSYLMNSSVTFKTEYRLDRASAAVFLDAQSGNFKTNNKLFLTSIVATF